jgi:DNA (cytosine-5)-methyltransferase 1
MSFRFIDLFAGVGGFHAAMTAAGGKCVYAVEIDEAASKVYERNWGLNPLGDITIDAGDGPLNVPDHDVLCAGFPCQPFSKSGAQLGMDETRGTLFWNILRIIEERQPSVVILENVRNLAGPRHRHEWQLIVETLRSQGYRVSETPAIFSPHLLPPDRGGRPQVRERVFITASRVPKNMKVDLEVGPAVFNRPVGGWDPRSWDLETDLPLEPNHLVKDCKLTVSERLWIDAWDEFVRIMVRARSGRRLPGFPLWADEWNPLDKKRLNEVATWKADYLIKNAEFYASHKKIIDRWAKKWGVYTDQFPASRRKLEWQAQDTPSLWDSVMHFRPSGIRAKAPTYVPALVAITQTSIVGTRERRLSPREAARLQGLPDWFDFGEQSMSTSYRQLGNGVSVGAIWHVFRSHVERDEEVLKWTCPRLVSEVLNSPVSPDDRLNKMDAGSKRRMLPSVA